MAKRPWCALNRIYFEKTGWTEQSFSSNTMIWAVHCSKKFRLELQAFEYMGSASAQAASSVGTCATKVCVRFPSTFCIVSCVPCLCLCLCVLSEETLLAAINNFAFWFSVATIPCEVLWNLFVFCSLFFSRFFFFFFPLLFPSPLFTEKSNTSYCYGVPWDFFPSFLTLQNLCCLGQLTVLDARWFAPVLRNLGL